MFVDLSHFACKRAAIGTENAFDGEFIDFAFHEFVGFCESVGTFAMGAAKIFLVFVILENLRIFNAGIAYPDFAFGTLDWAVHDQLTDLANVLRKDGDIVFNEAGKLKANH